MLHQKWCPFSQLPAVKKDTIFGAAQTKLGFNQPFLLQHILKTLYYQVFKDKVRTLLRTSLAWRVNIMIRINSHSKSTPSVIMTGLF